MRSIDKTIAFTFVSHPMKQLELRWQAKLIFPPNATAETVLPIEIIDGNEKPVNRGTFEFAGQRLDVVEGKASIVYADFIRGKSEVPLWLYRPDMLPVSGGLTFA